jgi:transposase
MLVDDDPESDYRAKIILLKDNHGYSVSEIKRITNHHDNNIRRWIYRFNEQGIGSIYLEYVCNAHKLIDDVETKIIEYSQEIHENIMD